MPEEAKKQQQAEAKPRAPATPLVFISHDSRDAQLAESFSALLRRVSAGMLKSFRSSDKKEQKESSLGTSGTKGS